MRNAVHLVRSVVSGLPLNAARGHTLFSSGRLIPGMVLPDIELGPAALREDADCPYTHRTGVM